MLYVQVSQNTQIPLKPVLQAPPTQQKPRIDDARRSRSMLGIFFAEFDNELGPKITFQAPEDFLPADMFRAISRYVITGKELCNKLVTITAFEYQIMSYPVQLRGERYHRQTLSFSLGMVFERGTDTSAYRPVLCKLASSIQTLELERMFLHNPKKKALLRDMIPAILEALDLRGEWKFHVDAANFLYLKLLPSRRPPDEVRLFDVPLLMVNPDELVQREDSWDLTISEILPWTNGANHVKAIAKLARVDEELVRTCIRQLMYWNLVRTIDVFQFSNVYVPTANIGRLCFDRVMQHDCLQYIRHPDADDTKQLSFFRVFKLYASLRRGRRVDELCVECPLFKGVIDPRRFITFGVVNGIIRRVHKYATRGATGAPSIGAPSGPGPRPNNSPGARRWGGRGAAAAILALCDGEHCFDEICCKLNKTYSEVQAATDNDSTCVVIAR